MINTVAIDKLISDIENNIEDVQEAKEILKELSDVLFERNKAYQELDNILEMINDRLGR